MAVRDWAAVEWIGWYRHAGLSMLCAALLAGCGDVRSPVAPSEPRSTAPVPSAHTGPIGILFLGAAPSPGDIVSGCGPSIDGCRGRVTMRFLLRAPAAGPVLAVRSFLHATNLKACLSAESGPFYVDRGEHEVALVFDRAGECGVPLTIEHLAVVVEGPAEIASRQEWSVLYTFAR
jgi:hypothetical protein